MDFKGLPDTRTEALLRIIGESWNDAEAESAWAGKVHLSRFHFQRLFHRIGHIQFADTPGRHEPGSGEVNFPNVFAAIEKAGYGGYIAAEYRPSTARTEDSLAWFQPYRTKP